MPCGGWNMHRNTHADGGPVMSFPLPLAESCSPVCSSTLETLCEHCEAPRNPVRRAVHGVLGVLSGGAEEKK